nr:MAG TPA: hypothetical protein [Caudoviricetes sp.]
MYHILTYPIQDVLQLIKKGLVFVPKTHLYDNYLKPHPVINCIAEHHDNV